jgi:NTP pyrophosphatase (non-canonical NTP hydrolase)
MGYLNDLAKEIYEDVKKKGFHKKRVRFGDAISLMHTELSEAYEEFRHHKKPNETYLNTNGEEGKPEGIPSEFADVLIRLLDNCHMYGIDIDTAVQQKMEYNRTRPYMHGGKKI